MTILNSSSTSEVSTLRNRRVPLFEIVKNLLFLKHTRHAVPCVEQQCLLFFVAKFIAYGKCRKNLFSWNQLLIFAIAYVIFVVTEQKTLDILLVATDLTFGTESSQFMPENESAYFRSPNPETITRFYRNYNVTYVHKSALALSERFSTRNKFYSTPRVRAICSLCKWFETLNLPSLSWRLQAITLFSPSTGRF